MTDPVNNEVKEEMEEEIREEMKHSMSGKPTIRTEIMEASNVLAPLWPVETFTAVNHLSGLEGVAFEDALASARKQLNANCFLARDAYEKLSTSGRISQEDLAEAKTLSALRQSEAANDQPKTHSPRSMADLVTLITNQDVVDKVNRELIKWCGAFFDEGYAIWKMPQRETGFFVAWRRLVALDQSLRFRYPQAHKRALKLPSTADETVLAILSEIGVSAERRPEYLARLLTQLPGWTSYIKWYQLNADSNRDQNVLLDYVAIRLFYELEFCRSFLKKSPYQMDPNIIQLEQYWANQQSEKKAKSSPESAGASGLPLEPRNSADKADQVPLSVWHDAYEINYRNRLLRKLISRNEGDKRFTHPSAQMVFCIDVRSEGFRRQLEALGDNQTIGFAGFFALPVAFKSFGAHAHRALCPVLLKPKYQVGECAAPGFDQVVADWASVQSAHSALHHVLHFLRSSLAAKFFFAEAVGLWCGPLALVRTFFPSLLKTAESGYAGSKPPQLNLSVERSKDDDLGISLDDRVSFAESTLAAMRLTEYLSPIVVLVGHKSSSENNPYASALDCGACGGNPGGTSARIACAVLNDSAVRQKLRERNILIPDSTWFVAAEHNTTTDHIVIFDESEVPESHHSHLTAIKADFALAGERLRLERALALGEKSPKAVEFRAHDWSQTRPEWGLAGNAAFIAARRELTQGVDLERRVFLHDYDQKADLSGSILETIITAPLIVAQWINMQYYLSTVDNKIFGAGTKVTHNVTGNIGVMEGAASDLKLGLPLQSIAATDRDLYHEPMRLLCIIEASRTNISEIASRHSKVGDLITNRWIRLIAWEDGAFYEATDAQTWRQLIDFKPNEREPITGQLVAAGGAAYAGHSDLSGQNSCSHHKAR